MAEASNDAPDDCRAVKNFRYDNDNDIVCKEKREWGSGTIFFRFHFPFSFDATGRFVNPPLIQKLCFRLSHPDCFFFNLEKLHRAEVPIGFWRRVVSPVCIFKSRNASLWVCASFITDLQLITLQRFCVRCRSNHSITARRRNRHEDDGEEVAQFQRTQKLLEAVGAAAAPLKFGQLLPDWPMATRLRRVLMEGRTGCAGLGR